MWGGQECGEAERREVSRETAAGMCGAPGLDCVGLEGAGRRAWIGGNISYILKE